MRRRLTSALIALPLALTAACAGVGGGSDEDQGESGVLRRGLRRDAQRDAVDHGLRWRGRGGPVADRRLQGRCTRRHRQAEQGRVRRAAVPHRPRQRQPAGPRLHEPQPHRHVRRAGRGAAADRLHRGPEDRHRPVPPCRGPQRDLQGRRLRHPGVLHRHRQPRRRQDPRGRQRPRRRRADPGLARPRAERGQALQGLRRQAAAHRLRPQAARLVPALGADQRRGAGQGGRRPQPRRPQGGRGARLRPQASSRTRAAGRSSRPTATPSTSSGRRTR